MGDLRKLREAVEAGEYHDRPSGVPRYHQFGSDLLSAGYSGSRISAMEILLNKSQSDVVAILRALEGGGSGDPQ